jgi:predicted transcriptional regulator
MSKLIIKSKYGIAPNELLNNKDISLKAKGLFTYMQSKPSEWSFSIKKIASQLKEGEDSIKTTLKELETFGYIERKAIKKEDGKWNGYDYFLYEEPIDLKTVSGKHREGENPLAVNTPTLVRKSKSKQEYKENNITMQAEACEIDVNYFIDLFKDVNISYDRLFANKTERESIERLYKKIGGDKLEKAINTLKVTNGEKYAPKITTPYELEKNFSKLCFFIKGKVVEDSKRSIPGMEKYQRD